jgi:SAM-dependent methyltransferase
MAVSQNSTRAVLRRLAPITRVLHRVAMVMLREDDRGQGAHIDPEDPAIGPPDRQRWTRAHREAVASPTMESFRNAVRPPGGGTERDGALGDLSDYYRISRDEALLRCLKWEDESLDEWEAAPRETAADIAKFYDSVASWSFDLVWYSYLQCSGHGYPKSVIIADRLPNLPGSRVLDLGSGVGVTGQLFADLGCHVTLADVSRPLLDFARWRLERRGTPAEYVHLPAEPSDGTYDLVTALDVMVHVPPGELDDTVRFIRRSLRPGGLFVTSYDVRRRARNNAWHLYDDDLPLRWAVQRAGLVPMDLTDGIVWTYRAVSTDGTGWKVRKALYWLRLASPPARALRQVRRMAARAALVLFYRLINA